MVGDMPEKALRAMDLSHIVNLPQVRCFGPGTEVFHRCKWAESSRSTGNEHRVSKATVVVFLE